MDMITNPDDPDPELRATSSEVVYTNRWMTVREDRTIRRDGSTGMFGVVEKPDFALIVPYADGGFHLVQQYRYAVEGRYWEFPQGSWEERPDADPLDLARGELAEETGSTAGSMRRLSHLYGAYGFCDQGVHIVLATDPVEGEASSEESEVGMISRWFSEDEVWRLIEAGEFRDAPSVAALALFQRRRAEFGV